MHVLSTNSEKIPPQLLRPALRSRELYAHDARRDLAEDALHGERTSRDVLPESFQARQQRTICLQSLAANTHGSVRARPSLAPNVTQPEIQALKHRNAGVNS